MIGNTKVTMIYAKDINSNGIGYDGGLAWECTDDLKFFKEKTVGKIIVVGSNTYKKLPKFRDRIILVLTNNPTEHYEFTFEQLRKYLKKNNIEEIVVCGGLKVYKSFLYQNVVDVVYESLINFHKKIVYDTFASFSIKGFSKEEIKSIRTNEYDLYINEYTK